MSRYKYVRITSKDMLWGKQEITKEYLINVAQSHDTLINLEDMTYFDSENNEWKPIEGDK